MKALKTLPLILSLCPLLVSSCAPKGMENASSNQSAVYADPVEKTISDYLIKNGSAEAVSSVLASRKEYIANASESSQSMALSPDNTLYKVAICAKVQLGLIIGPYGGKKGIAKCMDFSGKPYWIEVNAGRSPVGLTLSLNGIVGAIVFQDHGRRDQVYGDFGVQVAAGITEAIAATGAKWALKLATGIKGLGVSGDLIVGKSGDYGAVVFLGLGVGAGVDLSSTTLTISQNAFE